MRVSTEDQHLYMQRDALEKVGCEKLFEDTASGARYDRPGLAQALSSALRRLPRRLELDRLGRRMVSLIGFVEELQRHGVGFRVLDGGFPIDTTTAQGSSSFTSPPR
jgi:DNA invertase Pin-like site-specific DNA recombinase